MRKYRELCRRMPHNEYLGLRYADQVHKYITENKGRFLRDEKGAYHVLVGNKRIPLIETADNHALADLLLKACNITMVTAIGRR